MAFMKGMTIRTKFTEPAAAGSGIYEIRTEQGLLEQLVCPAWDHSNWRYSLALTKEIYASLFDAAVRKGAQTLFLPLLGEQDRLIPAHRSAEALWNAACRSDFTGRCVVGVVKYPSPTIRHPEHNVADGFRLVFFERPQETICVRTSGDGIPDPGEITILAQGLRRDPVYSGPGRPKMADGVFSNPEVTYQSAAKESKELAKSLFAVMHDMFYAPGAFVMNFAGVTENGTAVVILKMLSDAVVSGTGIPAGKCEADSFLVCRLPKGRGRINLAVTGPEDPGTGNPPSDDSEGKNPGTGRRLELTFFPEADCQERIKQSRSSGLALLYLEFGGIAAMDSKNSTAWMLYRNQRHWVENASLYAEYEWGEAIGHPVQLLGGLELPAFP